MKRILLYGAFAVSTTLFFSCQKASPDEMANPAHSNLKDNEVITGRNGGGEGECPATEVTLIAGQHINSGSVSVTNDADYIYVTYTTANGYLLTETHLYVGACNAIPVNNPGNPMPGQFPYSSAHNYANTYTYQVPISLIPAGSCGCIAAHAVVKKLNAAGQVIDTQTGWGNGTRINPNGGNWGMKFDYCSCVPFP